MKRILLLAMLTGHAATLAAGEEPGTTVRWNAHAFFVRGDSLGESRAPLTGGGGGGEAFVWRGLAVGGDLMWFRQTYNGGSFRSNAAFGALGGTYHFARNAYRGVDPFVTGGIGRFFEGGACGVTCDTPGSVSGQGGGGAIYWFHRRVGVRAEFRVAGRDYGDDVMGFFRFGMAFR